MDAPPSPPSLRLVHTSDWHLGKTLMGQSRRVEHAAFLDWLIDLLDQQQADALLIAGDVFDAANPPATAQQDWYSFLGRARRRLPKLDILVIGGNHDSAARLDAPGAVLGPMGIQVVGGLPRKDSGDANLDAMCLPLHGRDGEVAAWVAAVPFLRPADLPPVEGDDPLVGGVRALYDAVLSRLRQLAQPGQARVAAGHCYMVGGSLSELSERRILGGNQHALPVDLFPEDLAYVALGHLHRAQQVGGRDAVRYSGSPIPFDISETRYRHQVVVVDFAGDAVRDIRTVPIPRTVDLLRIPAQGSLPRPALMAALAALPLRNGDENYDRMPFLEVIALLPEPDPSIRRDVEAALSDKAVRLTGIVRDTGGKDGGLADHHPGAQLRDVLPEEVFRKRWVQAHGDNPLPQDLLMAFHELIDLVHQEQA